MQLKALSCKITGFLIVHMDFLLDFSDFRARMYTHMHTHTCSHTHAHTHMLTHTHAHTHVHFSLKYLNT